MWALLPLGIVSFCQYAANILGEGVIHSFYQFTDYLLNRLALRRSRAGIVVVCTVVEVRENDTYSSGYLIDQKSFPLFLTIGTGCRDTILLNLSGKKWL